MRIELDAHDHDAIDTAVKDAVRVLADPTLPKGRQHFLAIQSDGTIRGFYHRVGIKDQGAYELVKFVRKGKTISYTASSELALAGTAIGESIKRAFHKAA